MALIGSAGLEKKIFKNGGRTTDDGQRTADGPWLYYKLTNEPKDSGELKISMKSDFIHNFACFIHVYGPGAVANNPFGVNVLM